jgi:hypothetical protein
MTGSRLPAAGPLPGLTLLLYVLRILFNFCNVRMPSRKLSGGRELRLITSQEEKLELLRKAGLDNLIIVNFNGFQNCCFLVIFVV